MTPIKEVLTEIDAFAKLEPGWDEGNNAAEKIDPLCIDRAKQFLEEFDLANMVAGLKLPLPSPYPSTDGGVHLFWADGAMAAQIDFTPRERRCWCGSKMRGEPSVIQEDIPQEDVNALVEWVIEILYKEPGG